MRILFFTPHQLWPANTGSRLRNYQLARQLAAGFSVTFVQMHSSEQEQSISPDVPAFESIVTLEKGRTYSLSRILRGLIGPTPMTVLNCWSVQSARQLANVMRLQQFDTVQIQGVHLMQYLPIIQDAPGSPAIVIDWHNIESEIMWRYAETTGSWAKKLAAKRTAKLTEDAEDQLLNNSATHTVTSERERQKLLARCPAANIRVVPNGVDTSCYTAAKMAEACVLSGQDNSKQTFLFVGSMDYHANIDAVTWFSRVAWPEISREHSDIHFMIVGRNPAPEVRALASDRIHVTGTVEDVRPFYASALAAVVPIRSGSGTRLKILEAMAAGVPVLSTRLGAEGIEAEDDVHLLLADTGPEIAAAARRLVSSVETRSRISQAARYLVSRVYDWGVIGKQLYGIHADLVNSRGRSCLRKLS